MRILIMGGGVVGVTTAYQLLRDGHEVVLLERQHAVARETSWGNAGMIAPGHSFVWSSPRAPWILLKSLFRKDQALRFRFSTNPYLYRSSLKFLAECTAAKAYRNTLRKHRIAMYPQRVLHEVIAAELLDYDRNARGVLYFHRDQAALEAGIAHMQILADDGQEIRVLDRAQVRPGAMPAVVQFAVLGLILVLMSAAYTSLMAFGTGGLGRFLARHRGIGHWQGGMVMASISVSA